MLPTVVWKTQWNTLHEVNAYYFPPFPHTMLASKADVKQAQLRAREGRGKELMTRVISFSRDCL